MTAPESLSLPPTLALHNLGRGAVEARWTHCWSKVSVPSASGALQMSLWTQQQSHQAAGAASSSSTSPFCSCTKDPEKSCCRKCRSPGTSAGEPFPGRVPAKEAAKSGSCKALPTGTSAGDPIPVRVPADAEPSLRSASSPSTSTLETRRGKQLSHIAVNTG